MKVAIAGAHGVGKTFLAKQLTDRLGIPLITETVRTAAKDMGINNCSEIINGNTSKKMAFQTQTYWLQNQREQETRSFISDRSFLDIVAYMHLYELPKPFIDMYQEHASEKTKDYDMIIYCPIPAGNGQIEDDGFRLTHGQVEIDSILQYLFATSCRCKVVHLTPFRELWFNEALRAIEDVGRRG